MSLMRANLGEIVKKQCAYKRKANIDSFSSLVMIQMIAILFSFGGSGMMGSSSGNMTIDVKYYSADIVIAFTMIWSLVTAITITTKPYRNQDFTFVTNRMSSSLANIFFLLIASIIGAITASLASYLLRALGYLLFDYQFYGHPFLLKELILGIFITFLYVFCISSIGYLIGTLVQVNKIFIGVIPVLVIGSSILDSSMQREPFIANVFQFFFMESSIGLFIFKIVITAAIFFIASISILNRMEVRR
ncbi:hypothetical protein BGM26_13285 [Bacillus sp. FJAT-29790]|uniref:hypothetical protein n=1 Tax=Bacillus sp. FJAT-29790 TaxID=1895002 RepID=UPI001C22B51C|nr:hypothetical protein [Bacillus sp. FJAT-29790]MBU8879952.1 hypothetical protein [Bacillus sp. FJAT-29790]